MIENDIKNYIDTLKKYRMEIEEYPLLTKEKERELLLEISNGNQDARTHMINSNLRLSFKYASKYAKNSNMLLDLIQEANIGLMTAVDKFDMSYDVKFSTYAVIWIEQRMKMYLSQTNKDIRLDCQPFFRQFL